MNRIHVFLVAALLTICTGCETSLAGQTATPAFATAVLPTSAPVSTATVTGLTPAPVENEVAAPTIIPIEGTTTTQVNVRVGPSTASNALGTINIFTKVQIIGKDASGSWYQIVYPEFGSGFVRAEYVQVENATAEIPVIGAGAGSGAEGSALVIQKINVRSGPATTFESFGVLSPNDVVFTTGKDPSGTWIRIEFAGAPEGSGWVTSEFLQVSNAESLPVIGEAVQENTESNSAASTPTINPPLAIEDGDSISTPLVVIFFSAANTRAAQITGDVSAPSGDTKDWVKFSADHGNVVIKLLCSNASMQIELWNNETLADTFSLSCGEKRALTITPDNWYFLSLSAASASENQLTNYILNLETLR